jgi:uncharacterized protein
MKSLKTFARAICPILGLLLVVPVQAAQKAGTTPNGANATNAQTYETKKRQLSDIAVTIVTSGITCTCARFAEDIRDVVNDLRPDGLRVLPVMGVGGLQTLDDVLFLKGIDMGVADEDNLRLLKKRDPRLYADIEQRIRYITKLYNNEFHILARKDIQSIADLRGKKVSFNLKDSQTEVTADAIFEILKVQVERVNYDNNLAIKKLKDNEIQAMIVLSAAPQSALARLKKEDGVHLLGLDEKSAPGQDLSNLFEQYLPARLTSEQYPGLIEKGASVPTIANKALLVAYNWGEGTPQYRRLAKFVDSFFDRIQQFHDDSRHPKWKEVNLAADVPGWNRFKPAADWLARYKTAITSSTPDVQNDANLKRLFAQFVEDYTASTGRKVITSQDQKALLTRFQEMLASQVTTKATR